MCSRRVWLPSISSIRERLGELEAVRKWSRRVLSPQQVSGEAGRRTLGGDGNKPRRSGFGRQLEGHEMAPLISSQRLPSLLPQRRLAHTQETVNPANTNEEDAVLQPPAPSPCLDLGCPHCFDSFSLHIVTRRRSSVCDPLLQIAERSCPTLRLRAPVVLLPVKSAGDY